MNEIEEIKIYLEANEKRDRGEMTQIEIFTYRNLKYLLSSLEKKKEQSDYFRFETNRLTDELAKKKVRMEKLETSPNVIELLSLVEQLTERIKELESQLASIKTDESIGKLEVVGNFGEDE